MYVISYTFIKKLQMIFVSPPFIGRAILHVLIKKLYISKSLKKYDEPCRYKKYSFKTKIPVLCPSSEWHHPVWQTRQKQNSGKHLNGKINTSGE